MTAQRLAKAAALGRFELPVCLECSAVQYPPRERCLRCLSDRLEWSEVAPEGRLLARTTLHHSNEPDFKAKLPFDIGSVRLDAGPVAIVFLEKAFEAGTRVRIRASLDAAGRAILLATPY